MPIDMRGGLLAACLIFTGAAIAEADEQPDNASANRLQHSGQLIAENLFTTDDDLAGSLRYPFDHPKETALFLLGTAGPVAVDKPVTRYYQDKVEQIFRNRRLLRAGRPPA